tara:strand:- start:139 stop:690 length:552 start_codon:yes stop_codon:yes gene_type:complete
MNEVKWTQMVSKRLDERVKDYCIEGKKKLTYANEIIRYGKDEPKYNYMKYQTDILVYEKGSNENWIPRIVIEGKINSVTTHDAITYSKKAQSHKYVHPYLRYGILLGNRKHHSLPGSLFRHGSHFDFMLSWKDFIPSSSELEDLLNIVDKEIKASKELEEMIFNSRNKNRKKIHSLHKLLIAK